MSTKAINNVWPLELQTSFRITLSHKMQTKLILFTHCYAHSNRLGSAELIYISFISLYSLNSVEFIPFQFIIQLYALKLPVQQDFKKAFNMDAYSI